MVRPRVAPRSDAGHANVEHARASIFDAYVFGGNSLLSLKRESRGCATMCGILIRWRGYVGEDLDALAL